MKSLLMAMFALVFGINNALANPACAVCTVAVGASLGIARKMGVDDSVVAVWSGAFLALLGYWTLKWMDKKGWNFKGRDFIVLSSSVLMILFVYALPELSYQPKAILIFWIDPFLFATIVGALVLHYSSEFYQWMKKKNGGHAHFPFEKVVVPVVSLCLIAKLFSYIALCEPYLPDLSSL
ncbi:MAG: hypothetical protein IKW58_01100 [Alphaproteobacteria bacterium]|nr:hypothetical protein [Alphaproteobacteria bacterium]